MKLIFSIFKRTIIFAIVSVFVFTFCSCKKKAIVIPDLDDYASGLTEPYGDIILEKRDSNEFLRSAGVNLSSVKQAVWYAVDDYPEQLFVVEFNDEKSYADGKTALNEILDFIKEDKNCDGALDESDSYNIIILYTYSGSLDDHVDAKLWENNILRSWLYFTYSFTK